MDEFIKLDPSCTRIRIFIPAELEYYLKDYRKNWKHAPILDTDIDEIERVLRFIHTKNPSGILGFTKEKGDVTQEDFDLRHNHEVAFSDEVYAFQVNNSTGTGDTIAKARAAGLPITLHKTYTIAE